MKPEMWFGSTTLSAASCKENTDSIQNVYTYTLVMTLKKQSSFDHSTYTSQSSGAKGLNLHKENYEI